MSEKALNNKKVKFSNESTLSFYEFNAPPNLNWTSRKIRIFPENNFQQNLFRKKKRSIEYYLNKRDLVKIAMKRVEEEFLKFSAAENLKENIIALKNIERKNRFLELEKKGARIFSVKQLKNALKLKSDEVGIQTLLDKKDIEKIKKMPKNKMVKSLKNVLCEDSKAIKKMTKKKLVKFINKKFSSEMSSIDFSLHENLLHELQTRNKTVTNLNKGFLKKKLYEELLSEKALAEKEKIYRSDVQNQLNSEKSIFVLREKLKSLLANRYRRQAVDLGVAEILNIRNTKQTFNIIGFRLELFFLMVEETRRRFMERFFKAKRPLKLLNFRSLFL